MLPFQSLRTATVVLLSLAVPAVCMASEDHVLSTTELRQQIASPAQSRAVNLDKTRALLSSPRVENILRNAKMDPDKIQNAVASLNDDELARLATQADKIQSDITAGALSNEDLTYIVIALATAVVIIVIVKAS